MKIVDTLGGINGSMRDFSNHIENKLNSLYNSKNGKKYGMDSKHMRKYGSHSTLRNDDYEGLQREAREYLARYKEKGGHL